MSLDCIQLKCFFFLFHSTIERCYSNALSGYNIIIYYIKLDICYWLAGFYLIVCPHALWFIAQSTKMDKLVCHAFIVYWADLCEETDTRPSTSSTDRSITVLGEILSSRISIFIAEYKLGTRLSSTQARHEKTDYQQETGTVELSWTQTHK